MWIYAHTHNKHTYSQTQFNCSLYNCTLVLLFKIPVYIVPYRQKKKKILGLSLHFQEIILIFLENALA